MLFRRPAIADSTNRARLIMCVLAGGESRRFGQSKLRVTIDGIPILAWQAGNLAAIEPRAELWLSVGPTHDSLPPGANAYPRHLVDRDRFAGPLMGMVNVLAQAREDDIVLFVPADMPLLQTQHLTPLLQALRQHHSTIGVMASTGEDATRRVQPLPSAWCAGPALRLMRHAIASGVRGPSRLAARRGVGVIPIADAQTSAAWRSINYQHDVAEIAERLGRRVASE